MSSVSNENHSPLMPLVDADLNQFMTEEVSGRFSCLQEIESPAIQSREIVVPRIPSAVQLRLLVRSIASFGHP